MVLGFSDVNTPVLHPFGQEPHWLEINEDVNFRLQIKPLKPPVTAFSCCSWEVIVVIGLSDKLGAMRKTAIAFTFFTLKVCSNSSRCFITQGPFVRVQVANHARRMPRTWAGWLSPDGCKWSWEPSSALGLGGHDGFKDILDCDLQLKHMTKKSKPFKHFQINMFMFSCWVPRETFECDSQGNFFETSLPQWYVSKVYSLNLAMTLKRMGSSFIEEELRELLTYDCPLTGQKRCPPCLWLGQTLWNHMPPKHIFEFSCTDWRPSELGSFVCTCI